MTRPATFHRTVSVAGTEIFYREAGEKGAPVIVLLHGFPSSSHMFRDLIPELADRYHVIAPDLPGFGLSAMPPADRFAYTFAKFAEVVAAFLEQIDVTRYALYVMDYGRRRDFSWPWRTLTGFPRSSSRTAMPTKTGWARSGIRHAPTGPTTVPAIAIECARFSCWKARSSST